MCLGTFQPYSGLVSSATIMYSQILSLSVFLGHRWRSSHIRLLEEGEKLLTITVWHLLLPTGSCWKPIQVVLRYDLMQQF